MKRLFILLLLLINACSHHNSVENSCPSINIPREDSRFYYSDQISDKFQINFAGMESYCYEDHRNNRRYAVITPLFKVRRLEDSSVNKLDVSFYIKTSGKEGDFMGKQNYMQQVSIQSGAKEQTVRGSQTTTRIPLPPYDSFEINLGFEMSAAQESRAKKMFDIDYKYLSEEDLAAQNEKALEKVYLEIRPDEEVVYSECSGKPAVVKKNRNKSKCGN